MILNLKFLDLDLERERGDGGGGIKNGIFLFKIFFIQILNFSI
jgi:hypothetical protein